MSKLFKILAVAVFFLILPVATKACDVRLYAKSYMNRISTVVGGKKPTLVIESGIDPKRFGFYENGIIHIYKGDYKGKCGESTLFLKSVIAREYAHHIENKFKKSFKLKFKKISN